MFKNNLNDIVYAIFAMICGISIGLNIAELVAKTCS